MKKGLIITTLTVAAVTLFGCRQQPEASVPVPQQQTSTASIRITPQDGSTTEPEESEGARLMEGSTLEVKDNI